MPRRGCTVLFGAADGDLEFARQKSELGVQGAPLSEDFAKGTRVCRLINGNTSQLVARDVSDAVATGLNAVHVNACQEVHHIRTVAQFDPVELNVLARGEVRVAFGQRRRGHGFDAGLGRVQGVDGVLSVLRLGEQGLIWQVVFAGNFCKHAHLPGGELTIGNRHTQHGRVALDVPAILKAQGSEVLVAQGAI